jgi:molybdate transport system ATP-binding protein
MLQATLDMQLNTFHLDVAFSAQESKTTVLLGESGAGKSTVLKTLSGLLTPQKGYITFNSATYFDSERHIIVPPQERPFGYVFQDYVLFPHLNVFENVAFGLRASRTARREIVQRVGEALERVHLTGFERRRPGQLSGGQQQRVAIARALALRPQLLLLDEPLAALDVQTRREVRQELRHILSEVAITTILVTHSYLEALLLGEYILVLDHGHIIQQGDQRELSEYPRSPYIAELVGVNFFRGQLFQLETETTGIIRIENGTQHLNIVGTFKEQGKQISPGQEAFVVVAPHSVTLHHERPDSSARNVFHGQIVNLLRLGAADQGTVRVNIALAGYSSPFMAEVTEASAQRLELHEGQQVYVTFKATEASAYV